MSAAFVDAAPDADSDAAPHPPYRYWAFISYNHRDERHARWLHRRLESYRLPKKLAGSRSEAGGFVRPASLRPVYRDRDESSAGHSLGAQIKRALEESRNLIVVCSPNVARSRWVDEEVRYFAGLGRADRIFCLIVDGPDDGAVAQWMPAAMRPDGVTDVEPLAADARPRKDGRKLASLRLIAAMIDARFDELRQREQEQRVRRLTLTVVVALALLVVVGLLALYALQQRGVAQQQAAIADKQRQQAVKAQRAAELAEATAVKRQREAEEARKLADERRREAVAAQAQETAAKELARRRQAQAEAAEQQALLALKDATLRRLAAQSQAMFGGARAGGDLTAMRLALAGYAIEPRTDLLGAMQAMVSGDASLRAWDVPGNSISAFVRSIDGSMVIAATAGARSDYRIRFWRVDNGEPMGEILSDTYVTSLALTADGEVLFATDSEGGVHRWKVRTRERAGEPLQLGKAWINCIAVAPDGRRWVTGASGSRNLVLWTDTGGSVATEDLVGHGGDVNGIAFSPNGSRIVTGSHDKTIRLWDAQTGAPIGGAITDHSDWVTSVAFSPDGNRVASGSRDHSIRLWRLGAGLSSEQRIDAAGIGIDHIGFSPDGRRLVSTGRDDLIRVWDTESGKPVGSALAGHRGGVSGVGFTRDGGHLVSAGGDGTIRVWDSRAVAHSAPLVVQHGVLVNSIGLARSPGSRRVAATDYDGTLRQWDAGTGQPAGAFIRVPRNTLIAVAYSADDARLITASADGGIRIWNAETGRAALPPFRGHDKPATAVAASGDGKFIVSADRGGAIIVWDAASGRVVHRLSAAPQMVWGVAFSADSRRFAASGSQGFFALWNAVTGELIHRSEADVHAAYPSLTFGADGRYIAIPDRGQRTIALRSAITGRPIARSFSGHVRSVDGVAVSPDGSTIASADIGGNVRLWNIDTGEPLGAPISGSGRLEIGMGFSADGQKLVAASTAGKVFVWDAPAAWPRLLCERLTRNMSEAEWTAYVGTALAYKAQCPQYR